MSTFAKASVNLGATEIAIVVLVLALVGGIAWGVARAATRKKDDEV